MSDKPRAKKEWTKRIYAKSKDPYEPVIAEWTDGFTAQISDLCTQDLGLIDNAEKASGAKSTSWTGERDGLRLKIGYKTDRSPLWALMEKNKQILGFRVDWFDGVDTAYSELVKVAIRYASGELSLEQLKEIRIEKSTAKVKNGSSSSASGPRRRPAGAEEEHSSTQAAKKRPHAAPSNPVAVLEPVQKRPAATTTTKVGGARKRPAAATKSDPEEIDSRPAAATKSDPEQIDVDAVGHDSGPIMFDMADCMYS